MEEEAAVSKTCAVPESFYAPNFGKVEGAYCFLLVRPSVRPYVRPSVRPLQNLLRYMYSLKFDIWIPHKK